MILVGRIVVPPNEIDEINLAALQCQCAVGIIELDALRVYESYRSALLHNYPLHTADRDRILGSALVRTEIARIENMRPASFVRHTLG